MRTPGKVYLVGAGPGDPGLLSLRGRECLAKADLVLYDGLVNPLILQHTNATCQRTSRRVSESGKRVPQEEINRQLIAAAQSGQTIVRLKGGDPFVFGRGSEEASALKQAGIPYEIVPGVTAAVAAAEYAGISLTHRHHASAVAFVTGHEDPSKPESSLDYEALARFPGTLVFYMGLNRLSQISQSLINAGMPAQTAACIISHGTLGSQQTVSGTLSTLQEQVTTAGLTAPSLILIGDCVSMREELQWFENRSLFGQRIAITRPLPQAYETAELANSLGAVPVLLPTIEIHPPENWERVDTAINSLKVQDWLIFTSRNGVSYFLERLLTLGGDMRSLGHLKVAVIGSATATALKEYHVRADVIPDTYRAEELASELIDQVAGKNILWCGADRGREVLIDELSPQAKSFEKLIVYRNTDVDSLPQETSDQLRRGELDWLPLSSPSIARAVARLFPEDAKSHLGKQIRVAAISPVTAEAARKSGLPVDVIATTHTWPGIFAAIEQCL
ncbi:MAG: uroporphyrinogen-III C-methyltransferase [Planctomycetaceae bacterium]|nr:uroporphyrinogen-III C-methyltransferase [Planctomycetaceae bacterium]